MKQHFTQNSADFRNLWMNEMREKTLVSIVMDILMDVIKSEGKELSQMPYARHEDAETYALRKSPEWKYLSGKLRYISPDVTENERIINRALMLADRIHESAQWSHVAKTDWSKEFLSRYEEKIGKGVAKNAELCCYAGWRWEDHERYNRLAKIFVETIVKEPVWAYVAGLKWSDERFDPFAKLFVEAVKRDPECKYYARNGIRTFGFPYSDYDYKRKEEEGDWDYKRKKEEDDWNYKRWIEKRNGGNTFYPRWGDHYTHRNTEKPNNYRILLSTGLFEEGPHGDGLHTSGVMYHMFPWKESRRILISP